MKNLLIIIDPGHGIDTPGKRAGNLLEWQFNRIMAYKFAQKCFENNIQFRLSTFDQVYDEPLSQRVARANTLFNDHSTDYNILFLSFHGNAFKDSSVSGSEVFTSPGQTESDKVAEYIAQAFHQSDHTKYRPDTSDGDMDKEARFYVLQQTKCPAVLVEFGYYTNPDERERMQYHNWQNAMIKLLFNAVLKYYEVGRVG